MSKIKIHYDKNTKKTVKVRVVPTAEQAKELQLARNLTQTGYLPEKVRKLILNNNQ